MPINNNTQQGGSFEWANHWELSNKHAFLSPSQNAWLRYSDERMEEVFFNNKKKELGTRLHAYASEAIILKQKQARSKRAVAQFINDAIGYGMYSEITLAYSERCFGTADAILFKDGMLRIHDLKTGDGKVKFDQLIVYAALFCLEYGEDPMKISTELRIYQKTEVLVYVPEPPEILEVMDTMRHLDIVVQQSEMKYKTR